MTDLKVGSFCNILEYVINEFNPVSEQM